MPRDGTETYVLPFPDVEEDTTIESTVYNGFTNDVAQDLNTPRPVKFGGTGADNPADAMQNLGGELAKYQITNYDMDPFQAGSFYSTAGATSAPTANAQIGICYVAVVAGSPTTDMFIEARDQVTGTQYVRQKKANVWQGWTIPAGFTTGPTPPTGSSPNTMWWDNTRGKLFIYYLDPGGAPAQWVEAVAVPDVDPTTFVEIAGDAMTGFLTLHADPVNPMHATTKQYTDTLSTAGIAARAVRYDVAQTLSPAQISQARANIDVTQKNYIINGAMMVSQENGTTAGTLFNFYPADQWVIAGGGMAGGFSAAQVVSQTAGGSQNRLRVNVTVADASVAAGDLVYLYQKIEGMRLSDLFFGYSFAKTVTLQFGVNAPVGTYCVAIVNGASNRSYVAEYTIAAGQANVDVVKSITIPGDVTGAWAKDNTAGMFVRFGLMVGSTYQQAAGSWIAADTVGTANQFNFMGTNGNVFELFDVSLTEGSVAPPFVVPDYASELAACQRYFYGIGPGMPNGTAVASGLCNTTTKATLHLKFPVTMRGSPTLAVSSALHFNIATLDSSASAAGGMGTAIAGTTDIRMEIFAGGALLVAGHGTVLYAANATSALRFNARL